MNEHGCFRPTKNAVTLVLLALALSGCLTKEEAKSTDETAFDNALSGSVGDGPVVGAAMRVLRSDGQEIMRFESDAMAVYNITARAEGKDYPLTIDSDGGIDLVTNLAPDFILLGAALEPGDASVANVNPFSTFALAIARNLPGGITKENIETGQTITVTMLNSGLSSLVASGPLNTRIDNTNVSEIVKASEALAETVRRIRDLLSAYANVTSGDEVILRLASDLSDNIIDGRGRSQTDARTAAIAKVVAVQVLLEAASNELRVNGVDATNAMKSAVDQITTTSPQVSIDDQTLTSEMLTSVRVGLAAALAVSQAPKLIELDQAVDGLQSGMDYLLVRTLLPADYRATLDGVLSLVAGGDASVIATVNNINDPDGGDPTVNQAPSIQGVPSTSVQAGSLYLFDASASDPDGDSLTFSITGLPVWATFNETSGELSGTPTANHVATYSNISISVTDGEFMATLPTFSITVTVAAVSNTPPVISGTPATSVTANSAYSFTPTASDVDNNTLTFSVLGLPIWATFNAVTGQVSGTPDDSEIGVYTNIRISVDDGSVDANLAPFAITVNAIGLGSVTLNWVAPTENEDGSTLMDLDKYRIYWGTSSGNYPNSVTIDAGTTTYVVENLATGTYEFVATSINLAGVESVYSNPATKTVL